MLQVNSAVIKFSNLCGSSCFVKFQLTLLGQALSVFYQHIGLLLKSSYKPKDFITILFVAASTFVGPDALEQDCWKSFVTQVLLANEFQESCSKALGPTKVLAAKRIVMKAHTKSLTRSCKLRVDCFSSAKIEAMREGIPRYWRHTFKPHKLLLHLPMVQLRRPE